MVHTGGAVVHTGGAVVHTGGAVVHTNGGAKCGWVLLVAGPHGIAAIGITTLSTAS